jgi:hypothetical protein
LPRVEIQTLRHPRTGWVMVPIRIANDVAIEMVLNFGVPRSSISAAVRDRLIMRELIPPRIERTYVLSDVTADGQPLPPLEVRVSGALRLIGAGGILGLDFFAQYEDIHFHVPTFQLTLNGP